MNNDGPCWRDNFVAKPMLSCWNIAILNANNFRDMHNKMGVIAAPSVETLSNHRRLIWKIDLDFHKETTQAIWNADFFH